MCGGSGGAPRVARKMRAARRAARGLPPLARYGVRGALRCAYAPCAAAMCGNVALTKPAHFRSARVAAPRRQRLRRVWTQQFTFYRRQQRCVAAKSRVFSSRGPMPDLRFSGAPAKTRIRCLRALRGRREVIPLVGGLWPGAI